MSKGLAAALVVSGLLHGALAALGLARTPPAAPRRLDPAMQVDLEVTTAPAARADEPTGAPRPETPERQPPPSVVASPRAPPAPAAELPPAPGPAGPADQAGTVAVASPDAPGAGTTVAAAVGAPSAPGEPGVDRAALERAYLRRLHEAIRREHEYPRRARRAGIEGEVVVELVLDGAGRALDLRVLRSSGHDVLDEAALRAVRSVRFPAPPPELGWTTRPVQIPLDYTIRR